MIEQIPLDDDSRIAGYLDASKRNLLAFFADLIGRLRGCFGKCVRDHCGGGYP